MQFSRLKPAENMGQHSLTRYEFFSSDSSSVVRASTAVMAA